MSTVDLLIAHAPRVPERLRVRVAELEPLPRRRRVFVLVPAALAVAVAAAIVHGVVGSGSPKTVVHGSVTTSVGSARAVGAPTWSAAGAGSAKPALVPNVGGSAARLQHTEASLQITVPASRLGSATSAATRIATSLGGYAQSVNYSSTGESTLELRLPAQNVKLALTKLAALGTIVSQQLSVTDLQRDFDLESAQIAQLRRSIAAYLAALRNPSLPDAQRVILQIKLAQAKTALSQRLHARKGTVGAATIARISLVIATKRSIIVPVTHHRGRLGRMLHGAVDFLALEGTVALYALVVLSPFFLLAAAWWAKRRRDERLVME
ncbi:MAG TPA: DUF4349 domain-containing protein [Gaiellaceae bacterium]|nr:DUF4349 domain-containing protein [Gaiellaceae bacterium]